MLYFSVVDPTPTNTSTQTSSISTVAPTVVHHDQSNGTAESGIKPECTCSNGTGTVTREPSIINGVLGIYRITLWIIVLTLTVLSTAITSLTPYLI